MTSLLLPRSVSNIYPLNRTKVQDNFPRAQNFIPHIKRMSTSIMVTLLYGRPVSDFGNTKHLVYSESMVKFSELADPWAHPPLDMIPILKYVPARWARWKGLCEEAKHVRGAFFDDITEDFEARYRAGDRTGSFLEKVLDHPTHFDMTIEEIR